MAPVVVLQGAGKYLRGTGTAVINNDGNREAGQAGCLGREDLLGQGADPEYGVDDLRVAHRLGDHAPVPKNHGCHRDGLLKNSTCTGKGPH